mmetsp:Transcript_9060/g.38392  ORF Transcript_9060/g.38392 Transcript_9060/m.38392 type:complete len:215 (+) Transcript_9060:600-1244(+)
MARKSLFSDRRRSRSLLSARSSKYALFKRLKNRSRYLVSSTELPRASKAPVESRSSSDKCKLITLVENGALAPIRSSSSARFLSSSVSSSSVSNASSSSSPKGTTLSRSVSRRRAAAASFKIFSASKSFASSARDAPFDPNRSCFNFFSASKRNFFVSAARLKEWSRITSFSFRNALFFKRHSRLWLSRTPFTARTRRAKRAKSRMRLSIVFAD